MMWARSFSKFVGKQEEKEAVLSYLKEGWMSQVN